MKLTELLSTIENDQVAPVPARSWDRIKNDFRQTKAHETGSHGKIRVGRIAGHVVAVERVDEKLKAVRRFANCDDASEFVKSRLAQYDRFWDG